MRNPEVLTATQAAAEIQVSMRTIYALAPHVGRKVRGRWYFYRPNLIGYMTTPQPPVYTPPERLAAVLKVVR